MSSIKNIIFDLGNVLYDINFSIMYSEFERLGIPHFEKHFTLNQSDQIFFDLEKGLIHEQDFFERFRELTKMPLSNEAIQNAWNSLLVGFRKGSIEWITEHNKEWNIYLYSNTNKIHYDYFIPQFEREVMAIPFNSLFKKPYYSHEMGQRKPDPSSFQYIMEKEGLTPSQTLFVDDNEPNVIAAASVGLNVLYLKEGMAIERDIQTYLI